MLYVSYSMREIEILSKGRVGGDQIEARLAVILRKRSSSGGE